MDVMIDIETLNTTPDSVIATIGAVKFNRLKKLQKKSDHDTFYRRIDLDSCKKVGLTASESTVEWWKNQTEESQEEIFSEENRISLKKCLREFSKWLGSHNLKIWSHGDDFDCVILSNAYRKCGIATPWKFWNTRDTRTLFDVKRYNFSKLANRNLHHHALDDAFVQTRAVQDCFIKY